MKRCELMVDTQFPRVKFVRIILFILICISMGLLNACMGGGTTGSDGGLPLSRTVRIEGTITSSSGAPEPGVQVTLAETGDSAVSDAVGSFALSSELPSTEVTLLVQKQALDTSVAIGNIPNSSSLVTLQLSVNTAQNSVSVVAITISPRDTGSSASSASSLGSPQQPSTPVPGTRNLSIFRGTLRLEDGPPVPGARVRLVATGASDRTDNSGYFSFQTRSVGGNLVLEVTFQGVKARTTLHDIPARGVIVELSLVLRVSTQIDDNGHIIVGAPPLVRLGVQSVHVS